MGAAEAGFFPGIIFCLTRWFPSDDRARAIAGFMTAVVVAGIIGGPLSGLLLSLNGVGGLAGWQWLFVLEGLPAVVLGAIVLGALPEQPSDASWLTPAERRALMTRLDEEAATRSTAVRKHRRSDDERTRLAAGGGLFHDSGGAVRDGLLAAADHQVGVGRQQRHGGFPERRSVCRRRDRHGRRRPAFRSHGRTALAYCRGGDRRRASFGASAFVHGTFLSLATLSLAMLGLASMLGPFWALATSFLSGIGAAAGIALVNSVGNIGGFVGPNIIGYIRETTHSFSAGLVIVGVILACGGLLVLAVNPTEPLNLPGAAVRLSRVRARVLPSVRIRRARDSQPA